MSEHNTQGGVRERMIAGGSALLTRQGYAATTMRGIVAQAGTPWGSVHHFFPNGKEELALAAIALGDQTLRFYIRECLDETSSAGEAVRRYFEIVGGALEASGYEQGCPVATVALEMASTGTAISDACRAAMSTWTLLWSEGFLSRGADLQSAKDLGTLVVASVEGALILSRVLRSLSPMELTAATTSAAVDAALRR